MFKEKQIKTAKKVVKIVGNIAVASVIKLVVKGASGDNVKLISKGLYIVGTSIVVGMTKTPVGTYVENKFDEFVEEFDLLKSEEELTIIED